MNRTSNISGIAPSPSLQPARFSSRLSHLEVPTPLDRGDISCDSTRLFVVTNRGLERGESDLRVQWITRRPHSTMFQVPRCNQRSSTWRLSHLEAPTPLDRGDISSDSARLFVHKQGPYALLKPLKSAINCTSTSPDIVASPSLQRAQFSVAFIAPGSTHAAR